jgi:hypothetical protein
VGVGGVPFALVGCYRWAGLVEVGSVFGGPFVVQGSDRWSNLMGVGRLYGFTGSSGSLRELLVVDGSLRERLAVELNGGKKEMYGSWKGDDSYS